MTPIFGQDEFFHCDECSCKPESGWLFTCTQAVVRADGSIDPLKSCFLGPMAYTAVKQGKYTENEIKIMIKQRLAVFSSTQDTVPQFCAPAYFAHGYGMSDQGQSAKAGEEGTSSPPMSPSSRERQLYLKEKGLRVRFSDEVSYRSPSPKRFSSENSSAEETLQVQKNDSEEPMVTAEDGFAEYAAWSNAIQNMHSHSSFGSYNWFRVQTSGYGLIPYGSFSLDGAHDDDRGWAQKLNLFQTKQQNPDKNPQYYTVQAPAQSLNQDLPNKAHDDAYLERLGQTMDYHKAISDVHQVSQHRRKPQPQPQPVPSKPSIRSPFSFFKRDHHNKALVDVPSPIRPPVESPSPFHGGHHRTRTALPAANQGPGQVSFPSRGVVQVPGELSRGRPRYREQPQLRGNQRPPFMLHLGQPEDMNYHRVPVNLPARSIGVIDKAHLSPEYRSPPAGAVVHRRPTNAATAAASASPATPAGMVTRAATQKALPPAPPHSSSPAHPSPPRRAHPCDYKVCEACLEGHPDSETLLQATRYNPNANPNRAVPHRPILRGGVSSPGNPIDPHAQPFFFRPDFSTLDPVRVPGYGQNVMMRDAQYFINRDRDMALRDMVASRTVAATGQNPFANGSGDPLTTPMERPRANKHDPWAEQNLSPREAELIAEAMRQKI